MARAKAREREDVFLPDAIVGGLLERWQAARDEAAAADEREQAIFDELNALLDERVGEGESAIFITRLGELDPAKAGRQFVPRGGGIDYDRAAALIKERIGPTAQRKYFTPERITVLHANEAALAAAAATDPRIKDVIDACTTEGTPTLTRVAPSKASKELAGQARPLPAKRAGAGAAAEASSARRPRRVA